MNPVVQKSTRHSKITGNFAEYLVLYWLSKHGFECAIVDHTGLDIIATRGVGFPRLGISVKSRSRTPGSEGQYLSIPNENIDKLTAACDAFGCDPYFAIVVDEADTLSVFILSLQRLLIISPPGQKVVSWGMRKSALERYADDPEIMRFGFRSSTYRWWSDDLT